MVDGIVLNEVLEELVTPNPQSSAASRVVAVNAAGACGTWQALRPGVVKLIGYLNDLGIVIPKVKLAAQALSAVRSLLDTLCPVAPAASSRMDSLSARLEIALHPGLAPAAAAESPCDIWARVRPVIVELIPSLQAIAAEIPELAKVAVLLQNLQQLLDALCGAAPGANACSTSAATVSRSANITLGGSALGSFEPAEEAIFRGRSKLLARNYISYPAPTGLRPRTGGPFKVADLCRQYNFPRNLEGGGKIGILELGGGYQQSDLDLFAKLNELPTFTVNPISVNGGSNSPGQEADGEVLLDIQVIAATYYYCTNSLPTINVYFAPNEGSSFKAVIEAAVRDGCDVLSISWGGDEDGWGTTAAHEVENAAIAATQAGCVIFAASGDNSSGDGSPGANVDLPAACPHIIGCGGTTKTPALEKVWGDGTPSGQGTGGGYSAIFPLQPWQLNLPPGSPSRMVPDVSADADPDTGYLVVINGEQTQIGGTSAVAPLYSGLFAAFGKKLGFVSPTLWANQGAFADVTVGSNGSYNALIGPDPCSGIGVPKGAAIAALFVRAAVLAQG